MASFTITTPVGQDARILAAFGAAMGFPRPATGVEVKEQIVQFIINTVREHERQEAIKVVSVPNAVTPT